MVTDRPAVGSVYVTPDGTVFRLVRYERDVSEMLRLGTQDVAERPQFDRFSNHGASAGHELPDDAELVWTPPLTADAEVL